MHNLCHKDGVPEENGAEGGECVDGEGRGEGAQESGGLEGEKQMWSGMDKGWEKEEKEEREEKVAQHEVVSPSLAHVQTLLQPRAPSSPPPRVLSSPHLMLIHLLSSTSFLSLLNIPLPLFSTVTFPFTCLKLLHHQCIFLPFLLLLPSDSLPEHSSHYPPSPRYADLALNCGCPAQPLPPRGASDPHWTPLASPTPQNAGSAKVGCW